MCKYNDYQIKKSTVIEPHFLLLQEWSHIQVPELQHRSGGHTCTVIDSSHALLIGGEIHIGRSLDEIWLLGCKSMTWDKKDVSQ